MIVAHGLMEARLLLRNGEQLLLALLIPLLLLVAGVVVPGLDLGAPRRVDVVTPGVLALAVMSTAFTSLAIATAFERRYGVLKRLGASPLPRVGLLAGKVLAVGLVELVQVAVIGAAGVLVGWRPEVSPGAVLASVVLVLAGTAAFGSLGLLMAGTLRAEATLAAANVVYLLLLAGGATLLPVDLYPAVVRPFVDWLPSGALAEGLRTALTPGTPAPVTGSVAVLLVWAVLGTVATARTFRWE
jgi:ABC-2 type transport system permease protein